MESKTTLIALLALLCVGVLGWVFLGGSEAQTLAEWDQSDEVVLSVLPLSHIYAQFLNLLAPLYVGASVRFAEEPAPQAVRRALEQGGVTAFGGVPQFFALFRDGVREQIRARGRWAERGYRALRLLSRIVRRVTGWNPLFATRSAIFLCSRVRVLSSQNPCALSG